MRAAGDRRDGGRRREVGSRRSLAGRTALALAGGVTARALLAALRSAPPGGEPTWSRTNHRGEQVSLLAGPALAGAATLTAAAGAPTLPLRAAALVAGAGAGAVGVYDDLAGSRPEQRGDKGFRGHLRALRSGRVSAGTVKVAGIGAAGLLAARAVTRRPVDTVVTAGVVAGTANLVNLLDLRPGRALKASLLLGGPLLPGPAGGLAAGPVGAAAALLPDDLGEQVMIGDAGANALGAVLGLRVALAGGPRWRLGVLGVLVALTAASEKVSFTRVIESTPVLRELDGLGRQPGRQPGRRPRPAPGPATVPPVPAGSPNTEPAARPEPAAGEAASGPA